MILSRHVARRRIAAGVRPGWVAAWGLVVIDALVLFGTLGTVLWVVRASAVAWPTWIAITGLVLIVFIPVQVVLIMSAFWATRSRWDAQNTDTTNRSRS